MYAGIFILHDFWGISGSETFLTDTAEQAKQPDAALFAIALISSFGTFLLPSVMFSVLDNGSIGKTLKLDTFPPFKYFVAGLLLIISSATVISLLITVNSKIPLPKGWEYLIEAADKQKLLEDAFFNSTSFGRLAGLTFAVALLPAIAEECFFRGTLQRLLRNTSAGAVGAIFTSALAFSAMHLNFNNFLAIFFMGLMLGALYEYTGSLWVSILAHFTNNLLTIVVKVLYGNGSIDKDLSQAQDTPVLVSIGGILLVAAVLYWLVHNKRTGQQQFEPIAEN
jgi:membrane protease YdiL (CAAX protease family)